MGRKKPPAVVRKISFDPEVDRAMQLALGRRSMSDFVNDAVANRLARWDSPGEFISRKREGSDRGKVQDFDPAKFHPSGWPLQLDSSFWRLGTPAEGEIENLKLGLRTNPEFARDVIASAWEFAGLGEYTGADWAATQRWWEKNK